MNSFFYSYSFWSLACWEIQLLSLTDLCSQIQSTLSVLLLLLRYGIRTQKMSTVISSGRSAVCGDPPLSFRTEAKELCGEASVGSR